MKERIHCINCNTTYDFIAVIPIDIPGCPKCKQTDEQQREYLDGFKFDQKKAEDAFDEAEKEEQKYQREDDIHRSAQLKSLLDWIVGKK